MNGRLGLLAGLVAAGLVSAACGADETPRSSVVTQLFPGANGAERAELVAATRTVNIYVSEQGYDPATIQLRLGETVEVVFRNIGNDEFHYRIADMPARDLFWLDQSGIDYSAETPGSAADPGAAAEEHDHDHGAGGLVPMGVSQSQSGVQRWGDEVHAYAYGGKFDVIVFTPTKTGTYKVNDPLHPALVGRVIVAK